MHAGQRLACQKGARMPVSSREVGQDFENSRLTPITTLFDFAYFYDNDKAYSSD